MKQSITRAENIFRLAAMESAAFNNRQNAVSSSSSSLHSSKTRGHSTAQTRLRKILDIIAYHRSNFPSTPRFQRPESEPDSRKTAVRDYATGFEIDLNLRLVSAPETPAADDPTASGTGLSSCGGNSSYGSGEVSAEEKSSEGECAASENREKAGEAREDSKITEGGEESDSNPVIPYREDDEEEEESRERKRKYPNDDGHLGLLLEAVRQISGDPESDAPPPTKEEPAEDDGKEARSGEKWKSCWMLDFYCEFDDAAPIVRSNRGRNRALPFRLRDSVLEPWKRRR